MVKLMVVTIINERKTPNTMYRYSVRMRGLLWLKSMLFMLLIDVLDELRLEVDEKEETEADMSPPPPASELRLWSVDD
jgi:hypothetical protein